MLGAPNSREGWTNLTQEQISLRQVLIRIALSGHLTQSFLLSGNGLQERVRCTPRGLYVGLTNVGKPVLVHWVAVRMVCVCAGLGLIGHMVYIGSGHKHDVEIDRLID